MSALLGSSNQARERSLQAGEGSDIRIPARIERKLNTRTKWQYLPGNAGICGAILLPGGQRLYCLSYWIECRGSGVPGFRRLISNSTVSTAAPAGMTLKAAYPQALSTIDVTAPACRKSVLLCQMTAERQLNDRFTNCRFSKLDRQRASNSGLDIRALLGVAQNPFR